MSDESQSIRTAANSTPMNRVQTVHLILKAWAHWTNDRSAIRRWTGLGPGKINEAGPSSSMGRWVVKEAGDVWEKADVEVFSESLLERVSVVLNTLPDEQRIVLWQEYKGRGTQREKAKKLLLNINTYKSLLRRGKINLGNEVL